VVIPRLSSSFLTRAVGQATLAVDIYQEEQGSAQRQLSARFAYFRGEGEAPDERDPEHLPSGTE
jgi:hypothetical protein